MAGLGDGTLTAFASSGMLRRDQADKGGQLSRIVEAGDVPEFCDDSKGDDPLDAPEGLQGLDNGRQPPLGTQLDEFLFEALETVDLLIDGPNRFLETICWAVVGQTTLAR